MKREGRTTEDEARRRSQVDDFGLEGESSEEEGEEKEWRIQDLFGFGLLRCIRRVIRAFPLLCVFVVIVLGAVLAVQIFLFTIHNKKPLRLWIDRTRGSMIAMDEVPVSAFETRFPLPPGLTVSVVLMSFDRPDQVRQIVKHFLEEEAFHSYVREILIWDAKGGENRFGDLERESTSREDLPRVTLVRIHPDPGLHGRFAAALLAREPLVLIQDDDLIVGPRALRELVCRHSLEPHLLHGMHPRVPNKRIPYLKAEYRGLQVGPIILTKVLLARREHFASFWQYEPFLAPIAKQARPPWNGEDILFSLSVCRRNGGQLNRAYPQLLKDVTELPSKFAVSRGWKKHLNFRKEFTKCAFRVLGLDPPEWGFEELFHITIDATPPLLAPLPWQPGYLGANRDPEDGIWRRKPAAAADDMCGRDPPPSNPTDC